MSLQVGIIYMYIYIWDPYERASKLCLESLDHGSFASDFRLKIIQAEMGGSPSLLPKSATVGASIATKVFWFHIPNVAMVSYTSNRPWNRVGTCLGISTYQLSPEAFGRGRRRAWTCTRTQSCRVPARVSPTCRLMGLRNYLKLG